MASHYLHVLDGRIRIKIPAVKGSIIQSAALESQLMALDGVDSVRANPQTGNVLILHDRHRLKTHQIILRLRDLGWLSEPPQPVPVMASSGSALGARVTASIASTLVEVSVKHLISALL